MNCITPLTMYFSPAMLSISFKNKNKQVDRILFWLNSISIHAKDKDSVIFLVGTHRDSVGLSDQEDIDEYLFENLYDNFCDRLVVNSDRRLAFMVENSAANDAEIFRIKEEVSSKILEAEYMTREFPIRYLKFYKLILTKRNENGNRHLSKSISSHTDVRGYVLRECGISNNEELRDLLCVFHRAGEIIYQPDDPVLKQYVVFDPQILVDIMKTLVTIPPRHKRSHKVASCWHKLEKHGILHSSLIEHIAKQFNLPMHVIISLLTAYDVICPILQRSTRTADELYIVPCLLPPFSSMLNGSLGIRMDDWWMSSEGEEVYYFDFGYLRPDALFSRLHARCLNSDQIRDNSSTRQFFFDVGKFTFGSDVFFKLELLHHLPEQNLIKVNVQRATGTNSRMCVSSLLGHVEVIRRRDFKYLEYSFGFLCPVRHHRNPILQGKLHVVKLANQCCHLREAGPFNFLCEGQNHSVDVFRNNNGSDVWNRETAVDMLHPDRKIAEMPPTLHKQICNNLNVESMIAGDWRALAGEIGCSIEDVRLFSISKNPCDEVLHYWSTKYPVTIKELLEVLQRPSISRRDLVLLIKNHTVSQQ
ncbi:uncharacterized protein [Ptychodera flava]|uniref:uncharacterized protein n=1 Tax=Ptychodera flava TaxID=63121 RepID=UPI003969D96C